MFILLILFHLTIGQPIHVFSALYSHVETGSGHIQKERSKMKKHKLDFYTSHTQFYITDKGSPRNTASRNFWTNEAHNDRLAIESGIIGVGTECYGPVKGEIVILPNGPAEFNPEEYDHIVEGGLETDSGVIQILNCPDSHVELEIPVEPGSYRFRVYSSNLQSVMGDEGDDYYKIEVWRSEEMGRKVIKRYI